ncbi:CU044_5270 family protein [Streptosporangium sp. KLBMP 9127]|nr:CU044_5270 family protein [Streptosporangium sp. KLBMP 9127]
MDDLQPIRDLYGEPEADPILKARVRERLAAEPRRRSRFSWKVAVAGLAAAAVAAAVTVTVTVTVTMPGLLGEGTPPAEVATISGRSILLAAASTAAGTSSSGAYWRVRKLHRQTHPERLGTGENRYWLVESRVTEQWVARDGRIWSGSRALGARPRGAADEAAWRRDGSPAEWSSRGEVLSVSAAKGEVRRITGKVPFSMAGRETTFEEIQRLPADPAALTDVVAETVRQERADSPEGVLADALSGLLWSKPTPPDVRAAAYRALADLPGVRYLGTSADQRGRPGAAFSFDLQGSIRRTLIIDPASSQVLSATITGTPGGVDDRVEVVLEAGWTDDRPAVPDLP